VNTESESDPKTSLHPGEKRERKREEATERSTPLERKFPIGFLLVIALIGTLLYFIAKMIFQW
jgi:hypothetical protein